MADVICISCAGRYHETTEQYNPDISPNGSMFKLKQQYIDNGWSSFPVDSISGNLSCPECGGLYCEGVPARVRVDPDQYAAEQAPRKPGRPRKQ